MERGYVTIMDFSRGETHIYQYFLAPGNDLESFITSIGFDTNHVEWMTSDTIKLQIH